MTSYYHAMKQILAFSLVCFLAAPALAQLTSVGTSSSIDDGNSNSETAIIIAQAEDIRLKVRVYLEGALSAGGSTRPVVPPSIFSISITPAEIRLEEGRTTAALTVTAAPSPDRRLTIRLAFDDNEIAITPHPIVLEPNQPSAAAVVTALDDGTPEAEERISITLVATNTLRADAANNQAVAIIAGAAAVGITPAEIRLEEGRFPGVITITVTPPVAQRLTVNLAYDDNEVSVDPHPVVLEPNQRDANVIVTALNDNTPEAEERISIALADTATLLIDEGSSQTVVIIAGLPAINVTPTEIVLEEGGATAVLTITATPPLPQTSIINLSFDDNEISVTPRAVVIEVGQSSAGAVVAALDDSRPEAEERTSITLAGNNTLFIDEENNQAVVTIVGAPAISIRPAEIVLEEGGATGVLTITATPPLPQTATISLAYDANEVSVTPRAVVIEAGQSSASVVVAALDDSRPETTERISIALADTATQLIDEDSSQSVVIIVGAPVISIAPAEIRLEEGGASGMLTITATPPLPQTSTINLSFDDNEVSVTPRAVVLEAGQPSASAVVAAIDDNQKEPEERISIALADTATQLIDEDSSQSVVIIAGLPAIGIRPAEIRLEEGGDTGVLTITATPPLPQRSTINVIFDDSEISVTPRAVVLQAEQPSTNVVVAVPDDGEPEPQRQIIVTLALADTDTQVIDEENDQAVVVIAGAPAISITPTAIRLVQGGATGVFTITATPPPSKTLIVALAFDDNEINVTPHPIVLQANQTTANVFVTVDDDSDPRPAKQTILAVADTNTLIVDDENGQSVVTVSKPSRAGDRFKDCDECPHMVVVPTGSFNMGSPAGESGRTDNEGPVHRVTINYPLAVGVYEVTFSEWDHYWDYFVRNSSNCIERDRCPARDDEGWGRGRRPAINIDGGDANNYVVWLSRQTGKPYRLLSEAEWEYVARAGTTTPYHFGDTISANQANYKGVFGRTTPTGSFPANNFGLHDMHGNAWEWVEDCWHGNYQGAPTDGSAWTTGGDCGFRNPQKVLRGGSWSASPVFLRSAFRVGIGPPSHRNPRKDRSSRGFRVALPLTP